MDPAGAIMQNRPLALHVTLRGTFFMVGPHCTLYSTPVIESGAHCQGACAWVPSPAQALVGCSLSSAPWSNNHACVNT